MDNKLEPLLNSLVKAWWNPFWFGEKCLVKYYWDNYVALYRIEKTIWWDERLWKRIDYSRRELVSKESWLWQFVCENEMVFIPEWEIPHVERNYIFDYERYDVSEFQYWLMVWALLKEDELEQFLLQSIVINND